MTATRRPIEDCVVVVTSRSFGAQDPTLRTRLAERVGEVRYRPGPLSARDLVAVAADADGLLAGLDEISAVVFESSPRLRAVARYGVGVDRVDLAAAAAHGVTVTVTPGVMANAVAELTVGLLFQTARPILAGRSRVQAGEWPSLSGVELRGRTLGLVGLGRIGSLVAQKASALGMRVLAYTPSARSAAGVTAVDLETLAVESDFVSLHAPLTERTKNLIDRSFLEQLKSGTALINTARGGLLDEDALIWALDRGPLRIAALDVLSAEPPMPDSPLLHRGDVLITPHMAPHTVEATAATGKSALESLLAALAGRVPATAVTVSPR